ncbi:hypothetical protein VTK73DRAFT_1243 [Phialemonium thermophilum]|uniref:Uncharacterized protein n=1 Tax=Phialemonium thermophilum TaxID=223376 RepID=A0ABR3Y3V1_9PEZI
MHNRPQSRTRSITSIVSSSPPTQCANPSQPLRSVSSVTLRRTYSPCIRDRPNSFDRQFCLRVLRQALWAYRLIAERVLVLLFQ